MSFRIPVWVTRDKNDTVVPNGTYIHLWYRFDAIRPTLLGVDGMFTGRGIICGMAVTEPPIANGECRAMTLTLEDEEC